MKQETHRPMLHFSHSVRHRALQPAPAQFLRDSVVTIRWFTLSYYLMEFKTLLWVPGTGALRFAALGAACVKYVSTISLRNSNWGILGDVFLFRLHALWTATSTSQVTMEKYHFFPLGLRFCTAKCSHPSGQLRPCSYYRHSQFLGILQESSFFPVLSTFELCVLGWLLHGSMPVWRCHCPYTERQQFHRQSLLLHKILSSSCFFNIPLATGSLFTKFSKPEENIKHNLLHMLYCSNGVRCTKCKTYVLINNCRYLGTYIEMVFTEVNGTGNHIPPGQLHPFHPYFPLPWNKYK